MAETRESRMTKMEEAVRQIENEIKNPIKILEALRKIESNTKEMKKELEDIKAQFQVIHEKQKEHEREIKNLMVDNRVMKKELSEIREFIEDQEVIKRRNWLEISGIETKENENLMRVVESIHTVCQVPFVEMEITSIYRKKQRDNKDANVVIKFQNTQHRDKLQKAIRNKRLKASDLGTVDKQRAIFANDCLSQRTSRLFWSVRKAKFENKWKDA